MVSHELPPDYVTLGTFGFCRERQAGRSPPATRETHQAAGINCEKGAEYREHGELRLDEEMTDYVHKFTRVEHASVIEPFFA